MDFEYMEESDTPVISERGGFKFPSWLIWIVLAVAILLLFNRSKLDPIDPDIDDLGKYALIIENATIEGRASLSETQQEIFRSTELRLEAEKLVSKIEGTPGFFIIDKDSDMAYMPDVFKTMMTRAKAENTIPGIVIANEGRGSTHTLPESPERVISLLQEKLK